MFTSHIVQTKPAEGGASSAGEKVVYIPHSSDKTTQRSPLRDAVLSFTSHIVQTKLVLPGVLLPFPERLHPT